MARWTAEIAARFRVVGHTGSETLCWCAWHEGSSPKLYVNENTGLYYCQRCGARGALASLTDDPPPVDLQDIRKRLKEMNVTEPLKVYPEAWLDQFDFPHDYWQNRGFSQHIVQRFQLGYDPVADCVTIPLRDSHGRILGVIRRRLDNTKPKYMFPRGFKAGKDLFGSYLVRRKHYRLALVEGPLDAIACWDARIPTLALHGSRITEDQVKLLKVLGVHTVVCMTDNDHAGREAILSIKAGLDGVAVLIGIYRNTWFNGLGRPAKDPGELSAARRRTMYLAAVPWHHLLS
jgi:DNA primase